MIFQRIREAEREMKYEEYAGREGDIVTGIIQQTDARYTLLDLGKVEALLPQAEQVQNEHYDHGSRLKAYIVEVRKTAKGPQIVVSRTHPGLVKRLFELEVPEIVDGVVELKAIAREPGHRTKLAVASNDNNVDPVGACVGARGSRVRMVVNELRGEKVDIVPYSDDPSEFVMKALAPARVREVRIHPDTGTAEVIVPDFQLSLAIGKEGQNARLAARLTGWRVDIKSETQLAEEESGGGVEYAEGEWVTNDSGELVWQPAEGGEAISAAEAGYAAPEAAGRGRRGRGAAPTAAAAPTAPAARRAGGRRRAPRRRGERRPRRRRRRRRRGAGRRSDGARRTAGDGVARRVRTCVGCRRTAPVAELVRAAPDAPTGLELGRGPGAGRLALRGATRSRASTRRQRRRAVARALRARCAATRSSGYARDWRRRAATTAASTRVEEAEAASFGHEEDPGLRAGTRARRREPGRARSRASA